MIIKQKFDLIFNSSDGARAFIINSFDKKYKAVIEMERLFLNGTFNNIFVRDFAGNIVSERHRSIINVN